jgi:hypothetical protein
MAKTNNLSDFLNDLADGIRTVTGGTADIPAQDFSTEIKKLKPSSYVNPTGTKTITSSGTHDVKSYASASVAAGSYTVSENVTPSSGSVSATGTNIGLVQTSSITGTNRIYITVEGSGSVGHKGIASITTAGWIAKGTSESPVTYTSSNKATKMYYLDIESKTVTPSTSTQTIKPTANKLLSQVIVNAIQTEEKTATPTASSQSITPTSGKLLSKVTVNATPTETKTATPTKSTQTISPTSGKFLSSVTVNPIPSNYIIPSGTRTITANGTFDVTSYASAKVEVPASGHTVYKHTITITAPGATGSYGTSTISCSNVYLYSISLSTSIAGEYNASNWATLVGHFRNSFNTVESIVNPYNSGNCKGISTSCTGADGYLGTIYVLDYNGYIGGYLNYTYSSISYGSASASNYFLKNFNSGNVIVTDVVTEL